MARKFKLAVLNSHPIQYFAPLYRRLATTDDIDISVFFCSRQGVSSGFVDPGFGHEVIWDRPLLEGYRHHFLSNLRKDVGPRGFFSLMNLSIAKELWHGRFDALIIHGHNFATNLIALAFAKLCGTAVFMRGETHLLLRRGALKSVLRGPLMRVFYGMCDACLYIGKWNREFYEHHGVGPEKLFFVPYTVDNEFFVREAQRHSAAGEQLRAELGVDQDSTLILYASKLIDRKRPADLLEAFSLVRSRGVKAHLAFVGDGPLREALEEMVHNRGIPDVHFLGFCNQTALPKYYVAADVFVLPSEDEPWGLIINEVMCAGTAVITTSVVGASADLVLDGQTGFVYPPGDIHALASAIETLSRDPQLADAMGQKAQATIARWNYDECVNGIRSALRQRA